MARSKGPENEPGNPDGCVIGKKEARALTASVEVLSDAFLSGAQTIRASMTLLSETIFDMALKIEKVSARFNRVLKKTQPAKKGQPGEAGSSSVLIPSKNEVQQLVGAVQIDQPKIVEASAFKLIRPAMTKLIDVAEVIGKAVTGSGGIETPNYRLLDASSKKVVKTNPRVEVATNRKLLTLASMGTRPGSMYTHDIHCEKVLVEIAALLVQSSREAKRGAGKPSARSKKKATALDAQIDELRSKFPRLTKLFIDGPAKLKEEFKYWSGVMSTGWGLASSILKSGYKLISPAFAFVLDSIKNGSNFLLKSFKTSGKNIEKENSLPITDIYNQFKNVFDEVKFRMGGFEKGNSGSSNPRAQFAKKQGQQPEIRLNADKSELPDVFHEMVHAIDSAAGLISRSASKGSNKLTESYEKAKKILEETFKNANLSDTVENYIFDPKEIIANFVTASKYAENAGSIMERVFETSSINGSLEELQKIIDEVSKNFFELAKASVDEINEKRKAKSKKKIAVEDPRKHVNLASGGPATPSKDDAKGTDTVPAMLTPGEFVVNKDATKKNRGTLEQINSGGRAQKKSTGGPVSYLAGGGSVGGGGGSGGTAQMSAFMQGLSGAGKGLAMIGTISGAAVGSITGTIGAFNQITSFAGSFVQAFNPALMEQLNLVFKDLTAVIGMGLEPIIGAVIPIVRAFADQLVPVIRAMIPSIQLFADSMIQLAGPIITILVEAIAALEPMFVMAAGTVEMFAGLLVAAMPLIAAVIKEVVYWFGKIVSTIQWVVGSMMIAIGKVLAMVPGTGNAGKDLQKAGENAVESSKKASQATLDYYNGTSKVQKALQKTPVKGGSVGAAAGKASFSGISELGRNLMQSAMSSSTQASAIRTAENTQKTAEVLSEMNAKMGRDMAPDPSARRHGVR